MPLTDTKKTSTPRVGRPKKFTTPQQMQQAIDAYFLACDSRVRQVYVKTKQEIVDMPAPVPYTVEGLCVALDLDRGTLLDYQKLESHKPYHKIVRQAKLRIQQNHVERALEGENNATVSIFILKNNFGYKEKTEHEHTGKDGAELAASFVVQPITQAKQQFAASEDEVH